MKVLCAAAGLLLVLGCAPDSTSTADEPGDEATSETSPAPEEDDSPEQQGGTDPGGGAQPVAVELPGLPIGGSGAVFTSAEPTQCVEVSWTGPPLPEGATIQLVALDAPPEFAVSSSPCSPSPCLGGDYRMSTESVTCTVGVTWLGVVPAEGAPSSLTADARAECVDATVCAEVDRAAAEVKAQGGGTIPLSAFADESLEPPLESPLDTPRESPLETLLESSADLAEG